MQSCIIPLNIPLSTDFFIIPVRQRILYHSFPKGFLYYSSLAKDSIVLLSQRISLLFQSDERDSLLLLSQRMSSLLQSDRGFFIIPLSKDFFSIQVRQRIRYYSSLGGFLYYSIPTEDSLLFLSLRISLLLLSQRISLISQ